MLIRWLLTVFLAGNFLPELRAQDPEYSQFFANPLTLNPAFAGTSELGRVVVNYRNQWPQRGATYTNYALSYDNFSDRMNTGWGFQISHDRQLNQLIRISAASFHYAYHLSLGDYAFLSGGLQAGMVYKQLDPSSLVFPGMINQLTGVVTGTLPANLEYADLFYPDFAFGVLGQVHDFFGGFSFHHLNQPTESLLTGDQEGKLPLKFTVHLGGRIHRLHRELLSREFTLSPNLIYQQQGPFRQLNTGIYMIEDPLLFGVWYRNNLSVKPDALIFLLGIAMNRFQLGYSFDYTLSRLSAFSYGSHEISLAFYFGELIGMPNRRRLLIPPV